MTLGRPSDLYQSFLSHNREESYVEGSFGPPKSVSFKYLKKKKFFLQVVRYTFAEKPSYPFVLFVRRYMTLPYCPARCTLQTSDQP